MRGALPPLTHSYPDYSHVELMRGTLNKSINIFTTLEKFVITFCHYNV